MFALIGQSMKLQSASGVVPALVQCKLGKLKGFFPL